MGVFTSASVVLVLSVFGFQPTLSSPHQAVQSEGHEIPANIRAGDEIRQLLTTLLARSPTLRAQCARIEAAPYARIVIELTARPLGSLTRARATAHRYDSGLLTVVIELPALSISDFPELLSHEFEHVIELIEELDLHALARLHSGGVILGDDGVFETARAQAAGKAAAAEAADETDPAAAAIGRGVARAARLAWRGLKEFSGVKTTP
jgi:hypothetical protein